MNQSPCGKLGIVDVEFICYTTMLFHASSDVYVKGDRFILKYRIMVINGRMDLWEEGT